MAKSTGVILAAGGIALGNEFVHHPTNYNTMARMAIATMASAVVFAGIEKIPGGGEQFAVGIAVIVLVTVIVGRVNSNTPSPAQQLLQFMGYK